MRIRRITLRAAGEHSPTLSETALDDGAVIGFKGNQAGFEKLAAGYDDDIQP